MVSRQMHQGFRLRIAQVRCAAEADNDVRSRTFNRYRLAIPVNFSWADERGLPQSAKGITQDISASGVFVLARTPPPVGFPVHLEIVLPPLQGQTPAMRLLADGRVLRVEHTNEREGFVALNEQFVLEQLLENSLS